ncbi:MAG: ABC transporter substrate-binding protein [Candidatus Dormibacteraceae bacterium]
MTRRHAAGVAALLAAVIVALSACGRGAAPTGGSGAAAIPRQECATNRAAGSITYASPFGYDASAGILDAFVAEKLGYFRAMCLTVHFVTNSPQSTELVSSGRATVSNTGSAADDLAAVANGANVVGVATYGATSDYAILTRPPIKKLTQLEGGTFGYHFTVPVSILEMFRSAGVEASKVEMVDTTDYDPNQLVQGRVDGLQAYQSNEPLILRSEHHGFNEFTPSELGVKGTFNVELFNRAVLAAHRRAAADFLRADLHAFDYCVGHAGSCIDIEAGDAHASGATYQVSHEKAVWALESKLALAHTLPGRGVGVQSRAEWRPEAQALDQYRIVKTVPDLAVWEDTTLAASLYRGKKLVWP